jgi:hypothetical protein
MEYIYPLHLSKKNYYNITIRYIGSPTNALATVFHTEATDRFLGSRQPKYNAGKWTVSEDSYVVPIKIVLSRS